MLGMPRELVERGLLGQRDLPWYVRYGVTVLLVACALGLTWSLPAIRAGTPFMFFFVVITFSALFGSYRAGLLAVLLSFFVVETWVMQPVGVFRIAREQIAQLLVFFIVSNLIVWLVQRVDNARTIVDAHRESLRITLASIGDAVIATDAQGKIERMNGVAEKLTGWSLPDARGKSLTDVFHIINEQTRLPLENPVARVLAEGRSVSLADRTILLAKDGIECSIEDSAAPIRDAAGRTTGAVLIFHDISDRRAREHALEASAARLRMALEAGRMLAWEWDICSDKIWTTETAAQVYGVPAFDKPAEVMALVHPDDLPKHQALVDGVLANGGDYHSQFRMIRPDNGAVVWIEEWATALRERDGDGDAAQPVQKLAGVAMDITARKQAEEEIQRLNEESARRVQELQAVLDLALVGIAVATDPSCHVVTRNQTLAQWLGVSKGTGFSKCSDKADALPFYVRHGGKELDAADLPMLRAVAEKRRILNQELELARDDGFEIAVVASATPIYDAEGEVTGCVGTYTDVTERRAAELALRDVNEILERRVAQRTAELEQINHELVEFANAVSHDLRAPLRAITTLSEWIDEEAAAVLPVSAKEHLAKMRQRVERMERLLADLIAYTRAGRVHYATELVNTGVLVKDTINLLDAPAGFVASVVEPLPVFVTERVPLETVLRNVIGNAIKHHHRPAAGHVEVSARDLGEWYEFVVADDGPGVGAEFQSRILGALQTLRPRDEVEGSGMGLAIAKRLVEGRGGTIRIQSQPGSGFTLCFTWPKSPKM